MKTEDELYYQFVYDRDLLISYDSIVERYRTQRDVHRTQMMKLVPSDDTIDTIVEFRWRSELARRSEERMHHYLELGETKYVDESS